MDDLALHRRAVAMGLASLAAAPAMAAPKTKGPRMTGKGFTSDGLFGLGAGLQKSVDDGAVPGLVALVSRNGHTQTYAFGAKALGGADPMARDTIFRIASMTKLVTAAAVMMLVEDGKLRLDEPVDRLLPELANRRVLKAQDGPLDDTAPANRPVTVEDLLTFRLGSGIVLGPPTWPINKAIADLGIVGFGLPRPTMPYGPDEWLARLATLPLPHQPGEAWMYTLGSDIQGVLVARAAKQPFDAFVQARILTPLGMRDTGFSVPAGKTQRLCAAYQPNDGKLTLFDDPAHSMYAKPPRFPEGDSGLTSTVDDLLAFSRMMLAGGTHEDTRLLSEASVKAMTANHITPAQATAANGQYILDDFGWGYGMSVAGAASKFGLGPGAFGWSGGFGTSWYMDPTQGLTMILLTQRLFGDPEPPTVHKDFWAAAYKALA